MRLIDTHAHLNFEEFEKDLDAVLARAQKEGVEKIIVPSADKETAQKAIKLAEKYPQIYCAIGVHPLYLAGGGSLFVEDGSPQGFYLANGKSLEVFHLRDFLSFLQQPKVVAIGEVGLDYFVSSARPAPVNRGLQLEVLRKFFEIALEQDKPLIVHLRPSSKKSLDAFEDFIKLAQDFSPLPRGVVHCFSGPWSVAERLLALGFWLSFTHLSYLLPESKEVFVRAPENRIMLETDSPFLSPYKDKARNEPAFLRKIAENFALLKDTSAERLGEITSKNAEEFFLL
ncbi:TatD family hydrolase [bacterium]|nr:TatD family hydrolase [bacterium]